MDDTTQNTQPSVDPAPAATTSPVDPMDNVQVPDLPTTPQPQDGGPLPQAAPAAQSDPTMAAPTQVPVDPAQVNPVPAMDALQQDSAQAMQQMANMPAAPVMDPAPAADPMPQAAPLAASTDASSLGPVTMEDLMEELQHIEDKLDEMDEKL